MTEAPRSGVAGLTSRQVRDGLAENGWPGIPIIDHDASHRSAGKAPTIRGWDRFAAFDARLPSGTERAGWERSPSYCGAGTGVPCGAIVGIDIDVGDAALVDEICLMAFEAFGATPFVRQGRAPRLLLIYRADEPIKKQALKVNDGSGDGLDVMGEGSQFVVFGLHPKTCQPYAWLGAETPLTAAPAAAPPITPAQLAVFLDRVRAVLPLTKTGGGARAKGGESAEIVRDAEGFVVDGRESFMTRVVWRTIAAAGVHLSNEDALTDAAWAEFSRTTRVDVEGRRRTREECAAKVRGTLDRIRRKAIALPARPAGDVEATYRNTAVPLAEAEAAIKREIDDVIRSAFVFRNRKTIFDLTPAGQRGLPPLPVGVALRVEAGGGKTEAAVSAIAAALGLSVVYAVPTIELADQVAERLQKRGVDARVWRGRDQKDPDAPGLRMCQDPQAVADARRAGVYSVAGAVCSSKARGGAVRRCRHFDVCGHVRQRGATPSVWVVTHAMLFSGRPAAIPTVDLLVIDEGFAGKAVPDKPKDFAVDALERAGLPTDFAEARALQHARSALADALLESTLGPVTREALDAAGVTLAMARDAKAIEWARYVDPEIVPGQAAQDREGRVEAVAAVNAEVKSLAGLWNEIADFLAADVPASGRLSIVAAKSGARIARRRSLKVVHDSWRAPTLAMDATAPPAAILSIALGMPVEMRAAIRVAWHETGHVRQVVGAPVSSNQLGGNGQGGGERFLDELARYVALRAACAYPASIGVVIQKDLVERFKARPLPGNVDIRHFGALAGLDHWRAYGGIITIGRTAPPPGAMEADAAVLTGEPVPTTEEPFATGGILRRDGTVAAVSTLRLADPIAEALRWQVCEGNLIQALGRIRPLRLHGRERFFVDIIADVPLPIVVDEVVQWGSARPGAYAAMAAGGVIVTSAIDAEEMFDVSRKAARTLVEGATMALTSKERDSFLDVGAIVDALGARPRRLRYKRRGRQYQATEAFLLPNAPQGRLALRLGAMRALGSMESFAIEGQPPTPTLADFVRAAVKPVRYSGGSLAAACKESADRRAGWMETLSAAVETPSSLESSEADAE